MDDQFKKYYKKTKSPSHNCFVPQWLLGFLRIAIIPFKFIITVLYIIYYIVFRRNVPLNFFKEGLKDSIWQFNDKAKSLVIKLLKITWRFLKIIMRAILLQFFYVIVVVMETRWGTRLFGFYVSFKRKFFKDPIPDILIADFKKCYMKIRLLIQFVNTLFERITKFNFEVILLMLTTILAKCSSINYFELFLKIIDFMVFLIASLLVSLLMILRYMLVHCIWNGTLCLLNKFLSHLRHQYIGGYYNIPRRFRQLWRYIYCKRHFYYLGGLFIIVCITIIIII